MIRSFFPFLALAVAGATTVGTLFEHVWNEPHRPISATVIAREPGRDGPAPVVESHRSRSLEAGEPMLRRSILADSQIISYYGHPGGDALGVLGEASPATIAAKLKKQAAEMADSQPGRKVIPAFHIIAAVAQSQPQPNGSFLLRLDDDDLQPYLKLARQNGFLVFLDVQIGRSTVAAEVEHIRGYLEDPLVHLAIDPEFAWKSYQQPGDDIGSLDGDDINVAQRILDDLVHHYNLPNKILIVHQFKEAMITGKSTVRDFPGVDLVYDADGYGSPLGKHGIYSQIIATKYTRFAAIKLFFKHDTALIPPAELLKLDPVPSIVIYQ